jgi:DNA-binding NarL/FixJ family response regulator
MIADPLTAGREAYARHAWGDAVRFLQDADRESALAPEDLERLATAAYLAGQDAESETIRTRAHQEYVGRGDREGAARCAFWVAFELLHRGAQAPGVAWLGRAARLIEGTGDSVMRGYLLVPTAIQRFGAGDVAGAYAGFTEAAEIAERFGDCDLAALAGHGRGRALISLGRASEGAALLDDAMVAVIAGDVAPILAGDIYCSVLEACHEIFDLRRAREWTASLERWCAAQPDLVRYRGECLVYRAEIRQREGFWTDAVQDARDACARLSQQGRRAVGAAFYRLAELHRLRGELAKADEAYRQASQAGRAPQPGLALLRLMQGDVDSAITAIRGALDAAKHARDRVGLAAAAVEILLAGGDREAARTAAAELSALAGAFDAPVLRAAAAQAGGALRLADGDAAGALSMLREAWQAWRDLESPYEEAETRVLIARAAQDLRDLETCRAELDAARQTFKQLGAAPALARAAALATRGPLKAAGGLSEREVQVLRLVATGRTNRAIADELYISEKTVARHVSNIFNKLGVTSRAGATARAYQRRLI